MKFPARILLAAFWLAGILFEILPPARACEWDYLIWIPRSPTADPLFRFIKDDKAGYIDQSGKVVIPPTLPWWGGNGAGEFHDSLLEIGVSDGIYVDTKGVTAIDRGLYRGWDFSEGLAAAMEKDGSPWGYINTKGEFAIDPRFSSSLSDYVWSFEGGFAKVEVEGLFGFVGHSGDFAIKPQFLDADSFHDGMARVIVEGPCLYFRISEESPCPDLGAVPRKANSQKDLPVCKYSFIDMSGRIVSDRRFDYLRHFSEDVAPFRDGEKWGYIDKKGEVAIPPRVETAAPFADGLAMVSEGGLYGYIDHAGNYVISPRFKYAEDFVDGRAVVGEHGSEYWYIGHDGNQAFPGKFELASPFFKGLAHVKFFPTRLPQGPGIVAGTEEYACIDRSGRIVFRYER